MCAEKIGISKYELLAYLCVNTTGWCTAARRKTRCTFHKHTHKSKIYLRQTQPALERQSPSEDKPCLFSVLRNIDSVVVQVCLENPVRQPTRRTRVSERLPGRYIDQLFEENRLLGEWRECLWVWTCFNSHLTLSAKS